MKALIVAVAIAWGAFAGVSVVAFGGLLPDGEAGISGVQGVQGDKGETGPAGPEGQKGPVGDPGPNVSKPERVRCPGTDAYFESLSQCTPENLGTAPDTNLRPRSSGEVQFGWGCKQGYIKDPTCADYDNYLRQHGVDPNS
jgi:hypothetical protein